MAETISRIYLEVYETNKQFGKLLMVFFLVLYVVPFVAIEVASLTSTGDISRETYARIEGMTAMQTALQAEFKALPNPSFDPMPSDRPSRIRGAWDMRRFRIDNPEPETPLFIRADMPSRIKGVWNMRAGGVY